MAILVREATITFNDGSIKRIPHDDGSMKFSKRKGEVTFRLAGEEKTFDMNEIKKIELPDGMTFQLQNLDDD